MEQVKYMTSAQQFYLQHYRTSPVCRAASLVDRSIHNSLSNFIHSITRHHQCVIVHDAIDVQLLQNVWNKHKHQVQTQQLFHTSRKLEIIVFGCRGNADGWINQNTKSGKKSCLNSESFFMFNQHKVTSPPFYFSWYII